MYPMFQRKLRQHVVKNSADIFDWISSISFYLCNERANEISEKSINL